jgi:transposase
MMECVSNHQRKEEKTMSKITTIGLDLAKHVFHVVCCDARGKLVNKRMLKRRQVLAFFADLQPCRIGMEGFARLSTNLLISAA